MLSEMSFFIIIIVLLISIFSVVEPHSRGAPEEACETITPGHGLPPQINDDSIPTTCTVNASKNMYIAKC